MADTIRTRTELITLLADNDTFGISPQDIRDFLVSTMVYGGIAISDNANVQALIATTPVAVTNWASSSTAVGVNADFANDRIIVQNAGDYEVLFNVTFQGTAIADYHFTLRKNTILAGYGCQIKTAVSVPQGASFSAILTLAANDIIQMYVESALNGNMTVNHANLNLKRIG